MGSAPFPNSGNWLFRVIDTSDKAYLYGDAGQRLYQT
jgi:hypothetical protein